MGPKKERIKMDPGPTESNRTKLLNDKLASIEADISSKGEMVADDATKAMYLAFFGPDSPYNIKEMCKKLTVIEDKLEKSLVQGEKVSSLEDSIRILEVENHQTKVLLRNIPLSDPKGENFSDTTKIVDELLALSDQKIECLMDYYRLFPKKGTEKIQQGKIPPLLISFISMLELRKFIKNLIDIKKEKKFENLMVEHSCPPSLLTEYNQANKEAFKLRRDKKMVTRCNITKKGVILLVRTPDEKKFTKVNYPKE